eukprot:scaffold71520_cov50-Attheya_sp.AAC.4
MLSRSYRTALALSLSTNSTLKRLMLHYNRIGAMGAVAMATALRTNSSLDSLTLGHNKMATRGA